MALSTEPGACKPSGDRKLAKQATVKLDAAKRLVITVSPVH